MKVKYVLRNNEKYISNKIPGYRFLQSLYLSPVSFLLNMYGTNFPGFRRSQGNKISESF